MSKLKDFFRSPHIQIALAAGASIIILAFVSKRILPKPIGDLPRAIPSFLMVIYEYVLGRYKNAGICTAWYWVVAIFITTGLVILFHI